jgi:hypothetical protein
MAGHVNTLINEVYSLLGCSVGRGLCDGLITPPEESYCVSNCE